MNEDCRFLQSIAPWDVELVEGDAAGGGKIQLSDIEEGLASIAAKIADVESKIRNHNKETTSYLLGEYQKSDWSSLDNACSFVLHNQNGSVREGLATFVALGNQEKVTSILAEQLQRLSHIQTLLTEGEVMEAVEAWKLFVDNSQNVGPQDLALPRFSVWRRDTLHSLSEAFLLYAREQMDFKWSSSSCLSVQQLFPELRILDALVVEKHQLSFDFQKVVHAHWLKELRAVWDTKVQTEQGLNWATFTADMLSVGHSVLDALQLMRAELSEGCVALFREVAVNEICREAARYQGAVLAATTLSSPGLPNSNASSSQTDLVETAAAKLEPELSEATRSGVLQTVEELIAFVENLGDVFPGEIDRGMRAAIQLEGSLINRKLQPSFHALWRAVDAHCVDKFFTDPTHANVATSAMTIRGFSCAKVAIHCKEILGNVEDRVNCLSSGEDLHLYNQMVANQALVSRSLAIIKEHWNKPNNVFEDVNSVILSLNSIELLKEELEDPAYTIDLSVSDGVKLLWKRIATLTGENFVEGLNMQSLIEDSDHMAELFLRNSVEEFRYTVSVAAGTVIADAAARRLLKDALALEAGRRGKLSAANLACLKGNLYIACKLLTEFIEPGTLPSPALLKLEAIVVTSEV